MIRETRWPHMDNRSVSATDGLRWRFVPWLDTLTPERMQRLQVAGNQLRAKITERLKRKAAKT